MSFNTFGKNFRFTTWGESHGEAIGCVIDGCPPQIPLKEKDIQKYLDMRKPGKNRFVTQRREDDKVSILSGVFEGKTTGTPIMLLIWNKDQKSKDYSDIKNKFRPGHADLTYFLKYGVRDYRGGGRSSARETACRVAAGAVARKVIGHILKKDILNSYIKVDKVSVKKKYLAFSGLGNNVKFFDTLKSANYNIALTKEFEDHHNYKENEIDDLIKLANENNLKLITTEKDIVKIPKKYHLKINCLKMKIEFDKQDLISLKSLLKKKLND